MAEAAAPPRVAVLVATHQQGAFLPRALASLLAQDEQGWEALVLDDASTDATTEVLRPFTADPRVRAASWHPGRGLGATLNAGLDATTAPVVAYLPADDVWYRGHLTALLAELADPAVTLVWSGVRHHGEQQSTGAPPGFGLQLVQVAHRRTGERWTERTELESDDLGRLLWDRLVAGGRTSATGRVTCEWTDHPAQRHKAIRESLDGGLNVFRRRYAVQEPLRFSSSDSGTVDEVATYRRFRERTIEPSADGMSVLLVGELSFNPERVLALAERGHRLHGLWTDAGLGNMTVGPLPFGHVGDLPRTGWRDAVRALAPDVAYALLSWRAVPLAHAVLRAFPDLPLVWHFKESPQRSILRGQWPMLADLVSEASACLVATEEEREWLLQALPGRADPARVGVMDGDLPTAEWFIGAPTPKLSAADGQVHTAVLGRPMGLDADWLLTLARRGVHTHLYGQVAAPGPTGAWQTWWAQAVRAAPGHLHQHPAVAPQDWLGELSRYDAGWLHRFTSDNGGDLLRATWDDLNSPARLPVLLGAGLPVLQQANPGSRVAVERVLRASGAGLLYRDAEHAVDLLHREVEHGDGGTAARAARAEHVIEAHADRLAEVLARAASSPHAPPRGANRGRQRRGVSVRSQFRREPPAT